MFTFYGDVLLCKSRKRVKKMYASCGEGRIDPLREAALVDAELRNVAGNAGGMDLLGKEAHGRDTRVKRFQARRCDDLTVKIQRIELRAHLRLALRIEHAQAIAVGCADETLLRGDDGNAGKRPAPFFRGVICYAQREILGAEQPCGHGADLPGTEKNDFFHGVSFVLLIRIGFAVCR